MCFLLLGCSVGGDAHHELAEVFPFEQAAERLRRILEAIDILTADERRLIAESDELVRILATIVRRLSN